MNVSERVEVEKILGETKTIITGSHFVYAEKPDGWYHGPDYVNKDAMYPFFWHLKKLCKFIADNFVKKEVEIDVIVGPTVGGTLLAQWVAYWFGYMSLKKVFAISADEEPVLEKKDVILSRGGCFYALGAVECISDHPQRLSYVTKVGTRRVIKRGQGTRIKEARCLIVDDVITSGKTVVDTRNAVTELGGTVTGVGALCNRSGGKVTAETLAVPELFSLVEMAMEIFREVDCPICREKGVESVRIDIGHGREFLQRLGKM